MRYNFLKFQKKTVNAAHIKTIPPPKNVSWEIVSLKKIQVQNCPSENSNSKKNVVSDGSRYLVEKINNVYKCW